MNPSSSLEYSSLLPVTSHSSCLRYTTHQSLIHSIEDKNEKSNIIATAAIISSVVLYIIGSVMMGLSCKSFENSATLTSSDYLGGTGLISAGLALVPVIAREAKKKEKLNAITALTISSVVCVIMGSVMMGLSGKSYENSTTPTSPVCLGGIGLISTELGLVPLIAIYRALSNNAPVTYQINKDS